MGIKIEDLPLRLHAQVREQLDAQGAREVRSQNSEDRRHETEFKKVDNSRRRGPNKTELDYQRRHLRGMDARYEALTFRMANGHRYTPDWVVFVDGKPVACHECKGGYALHSQQRARLAFDQARVEFPGLCWVWAVKSADGWQINKLGDDNGMP
jgi:hypothetical protein